MIKKQLMTGVNMLNDVGLRIKSLRINKTLSSDNLAKKAGTTRAYIWKLESGAIKNPSIEKLRAIAKGLDVPIETLLSKTDKNSMPLIRDEEALVNEFKSFSAEKKRALLAMANLAESIAS